MRRGREILQEIVDIFEILRYIDLLVIFTLKWNIPKENTQWQTVLLVYCVTTVFNKLSILGSKLSLALEERSKTKFPWGLSLLVLNLMERAIPRQEAIESFSFRCFQERNSPFSEWLIFPLKQMPGGGMTEEAEIIMFCVCSVDVVWPPLCMVVVEWSAPCVPGINTAWDNFFFCMTAGNENREIQPLVFNKQRRYQSLYHALVFVFWQQKRTQNVQVIKKEICAWNGKPVPAVKDIWVKKWGSWRKLTPQLSHEDF